MSLWPMCGGYNQAFWHQHIIPVSAHVNPFYHTSFLAYCVRSEFIPNQKQRLQQVCLGLQGEPCPLLPPQAGGGEIGGTQWPFSLRKVLQ